MKKFRRNGMLRRGMAICLTGALVLSGAVIAPKQVSEVGVVEAAQKTIRSMTYFEGTNGTMNLSGVESASFGFNMPVFNGGEASWADVVDDLSVKVKVNGKFIDIDDDEAKKKFVYNENWGHWSDSGFNGYWFEVSETTELKLYSKSNPSVELPYTLNFTKLPKIKINSMSARQGNGPDIEVPPAGNVGINCPTVNGDANVVFEQVADDLEVYVKTKSSSDWVSINNNAASGWIYDQNFGNFYDGSGGYWFVITETCQIKLKAKSSGAELIYNLNYDKPNRSNNKLTPYEDNKTEYTADKNGAIGFALPKIGGSSAYEEDLEKFVYEVKINDKWVALGDYVDSTFNYSGNGYNNMSDKNQWGYWVDYIYGLWFQPLQQTYELRIGYPENGQKGGAINNNYVNYKLIGNPDAPRPELPDNEYEKVDPEQTEIAGWDLVFSDEFSGNSLDRSSWDYVTGYYIDNDPAKWGWGNNELEYYTDSTNNVFVKDGSLHLKATNEPKVFEDIDPNRTAPYASGKIASQNKFSFKYGRIDFRAKLPKGNGLWPALWMLPEDQDIYGVWAASGEIDVMEARGRVPGASSGAIHFGGTWPSNTYLGGDYAFSNGGRIDTDYHVYSVIWEEDMITWYVDGEMFFYATNDQWYSTSAPNNNNAPFDQEFYIIMNLAVGGWFDGGITPNEGDLPAEMLVDYVRVYQAEGDAKATHSGTNGAGGNPSTDTGNSTNPGGADGNGGNPGGNSGGADNNGGNTGGNTGGEDTNEGNGNDGTTGGNNNGGNTGDSSNEDDSDVAINGVKLNANNELVLYSGASDKNSLDGYYAIFNTKEEAEAVKTIADGLAGYPMTKNASGTWEYVAESVRASQYVVYAFSGGVQETPIMIAVKDIIKDESIGDDDGEDTKVDVNDGTTGDNNNGGTSGDNNNNGGTTGDNNNNGGTTGGNNNNGGTTGGNNNNGGTTGDNNNNGGTAGDNNGGTTGDNNNGGTTGNNNGGTTGETNNSGNNNGNATGNGSTANGTGNGNTAGGTNAGDVTGGTTNGGITEDKLKVNDTFTAGSLIYKITKLDATASEVQVLRPVNKTKKSISISALVSYKGVTFKVTSIANNAFKDNKKLQSVTIGKNVTTIGKKAFYNCKKLSKVIFKKCNLKTVGTKAFYKIADKVQVKTGNKSLLAKYQKLLKKKISGKVIIAK